MLKSICLQVRDSSQVGEARRAAHALGVAAGFQATTLGELGIISTELGTNLHKHAQDGELIIRRLKLDGRDGVEILALDKGPGMTEVAKCMEDGYSTAGTHGNGLGSVKRLSSVFDVYSSPQGTVIVSQVWNKPRAASSSQLDIGAICLPYPGETACGDAWAAAGTGDNHAIIVADGLGHGKDAAEASNQAIAVFDEQPDLPPELTLQRLHGALRPTRGAAVFILRLESRSRKIICSGIGNISSSIVKGDASKSFVTLNGTVGHHAQRFQEFVYDWLPASLVVMHSDGLQTKWKLDAYPGLQMRHPSLVAAVLYRDYRRGRDDVTVLVARENARTGSI